MITDPLISALGTAATEKIDSDFNRQADALQAKADRIVRLVYIMASASVLTLCLALTNFVMLFKWVHG